MNLWEILIFSVLTGFLGCTPKNKPTDKQRVFGKRTIIAAGPKLCTHIDPILNLPHDISLMMYQDTGNLNTAFRLDGKITHLYIGGEDTYFDSAIITGYNVKVFPGDSCRGEVLCDKDTTIIFEAFKSATHHDAEDIDLGMLKHDEGILAKLLRDCPCEGSEEKPLSLLIDVTYKITRQTRFEDGRNTEYEIDGICQFCFPCRLIDI